MKAIKVLLIVFFMSFSLFSQNFWFPTSNLSPSGNDFVQAVKAASNSTVFAGSWNVGMFRSTNNGDNWTPSGLTGKAIFCIGEGPDSKLFALIHSNTGPSIHLSSDNGVTWNEAYFFAHSNNYAYGGGIVFMPGNIAVAALSFTLGPTIGDIGVNIARSTDAGLSWTSLGIINGWGFANSIIKLSDVRILAATSLSGIWQSTNNGSFWTQVTSYPPVYTYSLAVNSNGHIFAGRRTAASLAELVFRSTDNGASWQNTGVLSGQNGGDVRAFYIDNSDRIYLFINTWGPTERKILRSTNNGANWQLLISGMPSAQTVYSLTGNSQNIVFAGTSSGGVFKGSDNFVSINGEEAVYPDKFELKQNYPNPFNPSTNIEYSLASNSLVSLKVFDAAGRLIKTLVKEYQKRDNYRIIFDASGLSSGIYFYTLDITGSTVSTEKKITRKMILIK